MSGDIYSMTKGGFHEALRQAKEQAWEEGRTAVLAYLGNPDPLCERPANPHSLEVDQ